MSEPTRPPELAPQTVLLLGSYRQTIAAVRSLAAAGHRPIVASEDGSEFAERSRFAAGGWRCPPLASDPTAFTAALAGFLASRPEIGWVFPMGDIECRYLVDHFAAIRSLARIVMPVLPRRGNVPGKERHAAYRGGS